MPLFFIVRLRAALPLQLAHLALVAPPLRAVCAVAAAPGAACGSRMCVVMVAQLVRASVVRGFGLPQRWALPAAQLVGVLG